MTAAPRLAGDELRIPTAAGELRAMHDYGLRLRSAGDVRDYGILCGGGAPLALDLQAGECATSVTATTTAGARLELRIGHEPWSFELRSDGRFVQGTPGDGHFVRRFRLPPLARHEDRWCLALELGPDTPVYGLGEKSGRLDKRGQLLRSYNRDALGLNAEWSYKNAPFAWSPEGWGLFVHTGAPVTHGVGYGPWSQRLLLALVEDEELDASCSRGRAAPRSSRSTPRSPATRPCRRTGASA